MHDAQAHALRRTAIAVAVVAATLAAHIGAMGWHGVTARTPFMAGFAVIAASLLGRRDRPFRARGRARTFLGLLILQAAAHAVLAAAPWTLGLAMHHGTAVPGAAMLAAHVVAAAVLTCVVRHIEVILERATAAVRAVRRLLAPHPPAAAPRLLRVAAPAASPPRSRPGRVAPSRGPPSAASA